MQRRPEDGPPAAESGPPPGATLRPPSSEAPVQARIELPDAGQDRALAARVESAIANAVGIASKGTRGKANASNVTVAVVATDVDTGRVIVARRADRPLTPASNLKLFTVAAAVVTLGPDANFETAIDAHGRIDPDGTLHGDLVLRAGGDPMHRREGDGGLDPWLDPLAEALRAGGIRRVSGALVLDEGDWLEPGPGPEWPGPSQHWNQYCALAGGFSANAGSFRATVTALAGRTQASVRLRPKHHGLDERIGVRVGTKNDVRIGATRTSVTVRGTLPRSLSPYQVEFSHPDPVELFGNATLGGLADRGISVAGGFERRRHVKPGPGVVEQRLHTIRTPIASTFEAILLDSNNPAADQLFLTLGARAGDGGGRAESAAVVQRALAGVGLDTAGLVQVDGSGLSKANRVSAAQFAGLVAAIVGPRSAGADGMAVGDRAAQRVLDALPVAGKSGSLEGRMLGTPAEGRVRAKTGWVAGASSLSGVAETLEGRTVAFSILVSYPRLGGLNTSAWKPMQDEIARLLVEWSPPLRGGGSAGR